MKLIKPSKEINIAYILITVLIICVRDITDASYWLLVLPPVSYLKMWIVVSYFVHKKRKKIKYGYSFHAYKIQPQTDFNIHTPSWAIMIPKQLTKHKRKWYQIFKKKTNPPSFHITDNPDGTKTWELK